MNRKDCSSPEDRTRHLTRFHIYFLEEAERKLAELLERPELLHEDVCQEDIEYSLSLFWISLLKLNPRAYEWAASGHPRGVPGDTVKTGFYAVILGLDGLQRKDIQRLSAALNEFDHYSHLIGHRPSG